MGCYGEPHESAGDEPRRDRFRSRRRGKAAHAPLRAEPEQPLGLGRRGGADRVGEERGRAARALDRRRPRRRVRGAGGALGAGPHARAEHGPRAGDHRPRDEHAGDGRGLSDLASRRSRSESLVPRAARGLADAGAGPLRLVAALAAGVGGDGLPLGRALALVSALRGDASPARRGAAREDAGGARRVRGALGAGAGGARRGRDARHAGGGSSGRSSSARSWPAAGG